MAAIVNARDKMLQATTPRVLPPAQYSLDSDLTSALWSGVPTTTVSDGAYGSVVRRSVSGVAGVLDYMTLFQIDRTRMYQTRFWARAAGGANGTMSHCLQQFTANNLTAFGPTSSGKSPLKPSAIAAHTDWREYVYTWDLSDWQTGVTHVRPDFLLNTGGSAGYWEVQAYTFNDVTDAMRASSTLALVPANCLVIGNKVIKSAGNGASNDAAASSKNSFTGGAYVQARADSTATHVTWGLSTNPLGDNAATYIDFAIYLFTGNVVIVENGASLGGFGTYAAGDLFSVSYDGASVRYAKNNAVFYTHKVKDHALVLSFDSTLLELGASISGIVFGPMSNVYQSPRASAGVTDNIFPDPTFQDLSWWSRFGYTVNDNATDGINWRTGNAITLGPVAGGVVVDTSTGYFPMTPGATYKVEFQAVVSVGFIGYVSVYWLVPASSWHTMGAPLPGGNWTVGPVGLPIEFYSGTPGGLQTYSAVYTVPDAPGNERGLIRIADNISAGTCKISGISITRMADSSIIKDGAVVTTHIGANAATDTATVTSTPVTLSSRGLGSPASNSDFTTLVSYSFTPAVSGPVVVHYTSTVAYVTSGGGSWAFTTPYCRVDTGTYASADDTKAVYADNGTLTNFTGTKYLTVTAGVAVTVYFRVSVGTTGTMTMTANDIKMIVEVIKK
jgi:hypothetical protein